MPLDEKLKEELVKFLNEKIPEVGDCPLCKKNNWSLSDTLWELREFSEGGGLVIGGPVYPMVSITCNNCGNTHLLNAIVTGVVKKGQREGKDG